MSDLQQAQAPHAAFEPATAISADDADLDALQQELARKKSRIQMIQERRRAKEEALRLQRELEERFQAKIVAASMQLLEFVKSFLEFVEILPREAMEKLRRSANSSDALKSPRGGQRTKLKLEDQRAKKKRLAKGNKSTERVVADVDEDGSTTNLADEAEGSQRNALRRRKSSVAFQEAEVCDVDPDPVSSSSSSGADTTDEESDDNGETGGEQTKFYIIPAFLLHSVESFFARVGIILRKRVGPGGVITIERHRRAFTNVRAEYPQHVVTVMLTYLAQHVVPPPPTIDEERLPFEFTEDDEVWEKTSQNMKEWLTIIGVTRRILNVDRSLRELLWNLRAYPLPRLTRIIHNVTRDVVSVCAQEAGASNNIIVEDEVTKNIHHHTSGGPTRGAGTGPAGDTPAGMVSAAPRRRESQVPPSPTRARTPVSPTSNDAILGVSMSLTSPIRLTSGASPARSATTTPMSSTASTRRKRPDALAVSIVTPDPHTTVSNTTTATASTFATRGDRCYRSLDSAKLLPDIAICAKALDPPLCFSDYSRIAPAHWAPMKVDEDVLVDAEPLRFGSQVGEPPIAGTPFKTVLQAKWSHYLYSAKELPTYAGAPGPNNPVRDSGPNGTSLSLSKAEVLDGAIRGRLRPNGRVAVNRLLAKDAGEQLGRALTWSEKATVMASLPNGSHLVATHQRAIAKGKRVAQRRQNTSVISRACLPLPEGGSEKKRSSNVWQYLPTPGHPHASHMLLPIDTVDKLMKQQAFEWSKIDSHGDRTTTRPPKNDSLGTLHEPSRHTTLRDAVGSSSLQVVDATQHDEQLDATHKRPLPRCSVRMVTLRSLVGRDERTPNESLNHFWERLQGVELKLSLLRGGGAKMPADERLLWKQLWDSCHHQMEEVVVELKRLISCAPSFHSDGIQPPASLASHFATCDEDEDLITFARRIAGTIVTSGLSLRLDEIAASYHNERDDGHRNFARPLSRDIRSGAFERDFEERGVDAIRSRIDARSTTPKLISSSPLLRASPQKKAVTVHCIATPAVVRSSGGWSSVIRMQGRAEEVRPPPLMTLALLQVEKGDAFKGCEKEQRRKLRTSTIGHIVDSTSS